MAGTPTAAEKLETVQARIEAYQEVKEQIKILKLKQADGVLETMVDWGESFYSEATVTDLDRIYICIGSGVFIDFTLDEAGRIANQWVSLLEHKKDVVVRQLVKEESER